MAPLFIIAKMWKQPKYPLIDEWIDKIWYISRQMSKHSAVTENEVLINGTTEMNLETLC